MHKHILARSVGLALLASGLLAGCGDKDGAQQAMGEMPPAAVDVVTLHTAPLQLLSELTGRTAPLRVAEVRPQVNGIILKRLFKEHGEANPTQFLIARELFRHLERVTDSFEDVANEIDGLVIDHA